MGRAVAAWWLPDNQKGTAMFNPKAAALAILRRRLRNAFGVHFGSSVLGSNAPRPSPRALRRQALGTPVVMAMFIAYLSGQGGQQIYVGDLALAMAIFCALLVGGRV
jgi:hypothetical protein